MPASHTRAELLPLVAKAEDIVARSVYEGAPKDAEILASLALLPDDIDVAAILCDRLSDAAYLIAEDIKEMSSDPFPTLRSMELLRSLENDLWVLRGLYAKAEPIWRPLHDAAERAKIEASLSSHVPQTPKGVEQKHRIELGMRAA